MTGFWEEYGRRLETQPDAVVLADPERSYTRRQLDAAAEAYAAELRVKGVGAGMFNVIVAKRDARAYVAMLGTLKTGAAFVTCEDTLPPERIEFIRRDVAGRSAVRKDGPPPAFAVYTSGTTGTPKCIVHDARTLDLNCHSFWKDGIYTVHEGGVFASISPISTVAVIIMFSATLYAGSCLLVLPPEVVESPGKLVAALDRHAVTQAFITPSFARQVKRWNPALRTLFVGSEPSGGIRPDVPEILDVYASSESGFIMSINGVPFEEGGVRVENGEIVFGDGSVHTGDAGMVNPDGTITVLGRLDEMIKIGGNRVEPAEIENAVRGIDGIEEICARGFRDEAGGYAVLFYSASRGIGAEEFEAAVLGRLPRYMLPLAAVRLAAFPHLANGKIDKVALPSGERLATTFLSETGDSIGRTESMLRLAAERTSGGKAPAQPDYPLLSGQGIYCEFEDEMADSNIAAIPLAVRFDPVKFPAAKLSEWTREALGRHPALKTRFVRRGGEIRQLIDESATVPVETVETREDDLAVRIEAVDRTFDLCGGELVRAKVFVTEKANYLFLLWCHCVFDGYSAKTILDEIVGYAEGRGPAADRYADFLAEMSSPEGMRLRELDARYFSGRYDGRFGTNQPNFDHLTDDDPGDEIRRSLGEHADIGFPDFLAAVFKALAQEEGTGNLGLCWTYHGRRREADRGIVGMLNCDLPMMVSRETAADDAALREEVKRQMDEARLHATVNYVEPCEGLYDWAHSAMMVVDQRIFALKGDGWEVLPPDFGEDLKACDPVDLELFGGDEPHLVCYYNSALFERATIERFLDRILRGCGGVGEKG